MKRLPRIAGAAGVVAAVVPWCVVNRKTLAEPGLLLTLYHIPFLAIVCPAGLGAGLVYWRIAGRTAGAATTSHAPSSPQT